MGHGGSIMKKFVVPALSLALCLGLPKQMHRLLQKQQLLLRPLPILLQILLLKPPLRLNPPQNRKASIL